MNKKIFLSLLIIAFWGQLSAQETEPLLEIGGNLKTDQRFLTDDGQWAWNENRLTLNLDKNFTGKAKFHSEIWLRNMGVPQYFNMSSLYSKNNIDPINYEIREANVQISGFLTKNLDLTIGKQRIAWGTADKINVTDNLNPYDFEDVLDFGRHRGSNALKADYYINSRFSAEYVFLPSFQPANLPVGIFSDIFTAAPTLPDGLTMAGFTDSLFLPDTKINETMTNALKIKGFVANFDLSLSYIYGRSYLPMPTTVDITPIDTLGDVNVDLKMNYPRQHIFGFDFAGNLAGIGVWGELAAFMHSDDVIMTTNVHTINPVTYQPMIISTDSVLIEKNKPYFKYVAGCDYTFANGIYVNFQYNHGFFNEVGKDNLNDYYFLRVEKTFFYDKLKIAPLSGAFIVNDYDDLSNNYTYVYMPQIVYKPVDNAEITLSTAIIDGKGQNMFNSIKDFDMLIVKVKYSF